MFARLRRCAALIAAYAIAIQAGLSAFAVAAPLASAQGAVFAICRGDSPDPPVPIPHDPCGSCLTGHCTGAAASPDRIAFQAPWTFDQAPLEVLLRVAVLPPPRKR